MPSIYIKTYGCSFNQADSENMAGILQSEGHHIVDNEEDADVVIINSCTVKNSAENKLYRDLKQIDKKIIIAGCVPQAEKDKSKFGGYSVIGTTQITKVGEVVHQTLQGNTVQLFKKEKLARLNIPKVRKNSVVEIVPINEGCLGSCNFCLTKAARGHLHSYPIVGIVTQIREALNQGVKELWLTSQDTMCYGYDHDSNIVDLLKQILTINRDFKIRIGMGNPDYALDFLPELLELFEDDRLYKFLHIPVQAGSDNTLVAMKREYSIDHFNTIIKQVKNKHPDMTIATDIIVGYPDETQQDFEHTMNLVQLHQFDVVNISRFWPRPGTIAAKKAPLPTHIVKERSIALMHLFKSISKKNNKQWIGWTGPVLINEHGRDNTMIGRNYVYKPIIIHEPVSLGSAVNVKITGSSTFHLVGKIIK